MTLSRFLLLSKERQTDAALSGVYLDTRLQGPYVILLFAVGGFYVEMYYVSEPNQILKFEAFKSTTLLDPYLTGMKMEKHGILFAHQFEEDDADSSMG